METVIEEILKELEHVKEDLYIQECCSELDKYGFFSQQKGIELAKDVIKRVAEKHIKIN